MDIDSFSMVSEMQEASVICSQQICLNFNFTDIRKVEIVNISFIDCERSDSAVLEFEYVDNHGDSKRMQLYQFKGKH